MCLILLPCFLWAAVASVMLNADVASGKYKAVKLKNLPKGAVVTVQVKSTGSLTVILIDSRGIKSKPRPLFAGLVEKQLSFSVEIPRTDNYFLVLDNRKGAGNREVAIAIQAKGPQKGAAERMDPKPAI